MSSRTPVIKQISWPALILQMVFLSAAMWVGAKIRPGDGMIWAAVAFLLWALGARLLIPRDHREGIRLVRQQRFADAILRFKASLAFFDRNPWIDQFRSVIILSPSAVSYREMALANTAFCFSQIGDGEHARRFYELCLERFPDSGLATAALRMMDAGKQARKD